jgi:two-component system LytT family response regulator
MPLKCIAIDDEPLALEVLKRYIDKLPALQLLQAFDDALSAGEFLRQNVPDLLFLDINMPDINGIELLKSLPVKPMVIFTTAYKQFAHQGFDLDAVDYLVKPISFERFTHAVNKARSAFQARNTDAESEEDFLFVRSEYKLVKIELAQIDYIENLGDYLKVYINGQKPVMTLMTLKNIATKLPPEKFARIHRSYIVPLRKIVSIVNQKVLLSNQTELPIGESYIENLNKWIRK